MSQRWLRPVRLTFAILFLSGFLLLYSDAKALLPTGIYTFFTSFQFIASILKFLEYPGVITAGFIFILILTVLSGRVYCSVFCPLGILQDVIAFFRRNIPGLASPKRRFKKALNYLRYPILVLFLLCLFFIGTIAITWLDPYANFGRIASSICQPVFLALNNLLSAALTSIGMYGIQPMAMKVFSPIVFFSASGMMLLILLMVIYRDRLYCNSICPVGTFLGLVSRFSVFRIGITRSGCSQCGKCQAACKSNCIDIRKMYVDMSRCVACYNCISSCDEGSIHYENKWIGPGTEFQSGSRGKREFLKAGLLFLGFYPLLAKGRENEDEEDPGHNRKRRFWTRGPVSPPGSQSIDHLKDHCIGCQLCVSSCPTKVLQPSFLEYGFAGMMMPRLDNTKGFCNFECTKCSEICPTAALLPVSKEAKKTLQIGRVHFAKRHCIVASEGTACGSCSEHCPTQAVYMVPYKDDLTLPETNPDICVGCGACEYACPVTDPHPAIYVLSNAVHQVAEKPVSEKLQTKETTDFPF